MTLQPQMKQRGWLIIAAFVALSLSSLPDARLISGEKKTPSPPKIEELIAFTTAIRAEDPFDPANALTSKGPAKVRRGQVVRVELSGKLTNGWNTYPITQRTSQQSKAQLTSWTLQTKPGITALHPIMESAPLKYPDKVLGTYFKYIDPFTWSQDVLIAEDASPGKIEVGIKLRIQICSTGCIWFDHLISVPFEISDEKPTPISAEVIARTKTVAPEIAVVDVGGSSEPAPAPAIESKVSHAAGLIRDSFDQYKSKMEAIAAQLTSNVAVGAAGPGESDLLAFILAGIFWGAISLVTPCVFPMIPITVSYFLKQSEKEHQRPIVLASVYSGTIVVVLTLAAAFLLSVFREMSIHPITNIVIGGLFIFFALSLFGMYEIELPQSLARFTSSREGKGGVIGTIFMALTFTIISFACVAPFLGGFGGTAAGLRPWWHNLLGGLAFSVTFASPFFLLALFPAMLKKMPKSGSWLNVVKVVMGFLEFAAAFKFLRTAELIWSQGVTSLLTYDLILAAWIGLSVLCGLYLIGAYRLPHDSPEEHISVPRLLFSAAFLALAIYLTPALFKVGANGQSQRPSGAVYAWVDSFLLPDSHDEDSSTANLDYAVNLSRLEATKSGKAKRIFVDFTGVSCTNCKINEKSVFTKSEFAKLLSQFIFVKMYTDTVPPEYYGAEIRADIARDSNRPIRDAKEVNLAFQKKQFGTEQLPLYVILEPQQDGKIKVLGLYDEGRINNEPAFAEFLRNPEKK